MLWIAPQVAASLFSIREKTRHVMIIFAHPDDEAMFFSPLLLSLYGRCKVTFVCLSTGNTCCLSSVTNTGNAEGFGTIRRHELITSGKYFGVDAQDIVQIDDPLLQDGLDTKWQPSVIAQHIHKLLLTLQPNTVSYNISFYVIYTRWLPSMQMGCLSTLTTLRHTTVCGKHSSLFQLSLVSNYILRVLFGNLWVY